MITTEPLDDGATAGSDASNWGAAAKKVLPYGWRTTTSPGGTARGGSVSTMTSGWERSHRLTRMALDRWTTNRSIEIPMPARTASGSGRSRVRTNVTASTTAWTGPSFQTDSMRSTSIVRTPTVT